MIKLLEEVKIKNCSKSFQLLEHQYSKLINVVMSKFIKYNKGFISIDREDWKQVSQISLLNSVRKFRIKPTIIVTKTKKYYYKDNIKIYLDTETKYEIIEQHRMPFASFLYYQLKSETNIMLRQIIKSKNEIAMTSLNSNCIKDDNSNNKIIDNIKSDSLMLDENYFLSKFKKCLSKKEQIVLCKHLGEINEPVKNFNKRLMKIKDKMYKHFC